MLQYGLRKERFPCWCVLIRLELAGPATACLMADLERQDYLLQLLPPLMSPLLKGQVTLALFHSIVGLIANKKGSHPT